MLAKLLILKFYSKLALHHLEKLLQLSFSVLDDKIDAELIQARKMRFGRIVDSSPIPKLFDDLKKGDTLWWLDVYCPNHDEWMCHVDKAIQRGASIKMLIPDPDTPFCHLRAEEISEYYKNDKYILNLRILRRILKIIKKSLMNKEIQV